MGTKRTLAPLVRREIDEIEPSGQVADLFAGLGSVAQAMASEYAVLVNDGLAFTGPLARARFTNCSVPRPSVDTVLTAIYPKFAKRERQLTTRFAERIAREKEAVANGRSGLASYFEIANHVGNSRDYQRQARAAASRSDAGRYALATLYYSGGYFSTRQAIELDALRLAIDAYPLARDWLISAWLSAASAVINAPGHAAQYLKPNNVRTFDRIRRQWRRSVWPVFVSKLEAISPVGEGAWRQANVVTQADALAVLGSDQFEGVGVVYADPPYTKDQYSRYYHLYETLFLYDYPDSTGGGRYRTDRFTSSFSLASRVCDAFEGLFERVATRGIPLILSYPERSLLSRKGLDVRDLLAPFLRIEKEIVVKYQHSTMGASKGPSHLDASEQLFVCFPKE